MKADEFLLGIDLGTTALKAAVFRLHSGELAAAATEYLAIAAGPDGRRQENLAEIEAALARARKCLRQSLGRRWQGIKGIGVAAQGGSIAIVDRVTGQPLTPLYLWNDSRGLAFMPRIMRSRPPSFWRCRTRRDVPAAGLGRLLWLKKTQPALFTKRHICVGAGEFLFFKLTNVWQQDPGNALQLGCYNAQRNCLDRLLLAIAGVPLSFVAPLRHAQKLHALSPRGAKFLGLPAGIPVAGPYMDQEASYLAAGHISRALLQCSLGTAWVGNLVLPPGVRWHAPLQLVIPSPLGIGSLIMQPLLTGNVTWDWALAQFAHKDSAQALQQAEKIFQKRLLPATAAIALPWLNIANPLIKGEHGSGGFFGISPSTDKEDLLRAVAASMACEMFRVLAEAVRSRWVDNVVLSGGASKGWFFQALLTALFAPLPVYVMREQDMAACRGAIRVLSRKAGSAAYARAPRPLLAEQRRIRAYYDRYLTVFSRFYASLPLAAELRFAN